MLTFIATSGCRSQKSVCFYSIQSWRLSRNLHLLQIMDPLCGQSLWGNPVPIWRQTVIGHKLWVNKWWVTSSHYHPMSDQSEGWRVSIDQWEARHWHWGGDNDSSLTILALNQPNPHTASCFRKWLTKMSNNNLETRNSAAMLSASKVGYIIISPS